MALYASNHHLFVYHTAVYTNRFLNSNQERLSFWAQWKLSDVSYHVISYCSPWITWICWKTSLLHSTSSYFNTRPITSRCTARFLTNPNRLFPQAKSRKRKTSNLHLRKNRVVRSWSFLSTRPSRLLAILVWIVCLSWRPASASEHDNQARNQLGTPGGAKSFLRGVQIFWTLSNIFKLYPTHFSRGGEKFYRELRPPCAPPGYGPDDKPATGLMQQTTSHDLFNLTALYCVLDIDLVSAKSLPKHMTLFVSYLPHFWLTWRLSRSNKLQRGRLSWSKLCKDAVLLFTSLRVVICVKNENLSSLQCHVTDIATCSFDNHHVVRFHVIAWKRVTGFCRFSDTIVWWRNTRITNSAWWVFCFRVSINAPRSPWGRRCSSNYRKAQVNPKSLLPPWRNRRWKRWNCR